MTPEEFKKLNCCERSMIRQMEVDLHYKDNCVKEEREGCAQIVEAAGCSGINCTNGNHAIKCPIYLAALLRR